MDAHLADLEAIEKIAAGDRRAFETLYRNHSTPVFKFLVRLSGNRSIAEELTHDVFMEVWKSAKRFERRSTVRTWIMSIARFKALDAHRRTKTVTADDFPLAYEPTPEQISMKSSTDSAMKKCLNGLSVEHREIVDLVYFHEMSVKDVSAILSIPEATVKTRMFYARQKLKELLLEHGDSSDAFSFGK